eukprot:CAMPEP_0114589136 /NCGR_PEP_ID=MMETSP0125-20121206/11663_1 /TAXON_ID=485358 ORGANISM="Aristerostoma sp., Strain ATCC 50986" /NCGR_SAMPLE_ID=MMETSP0125 /ASSEMBLY_ACC=CAM_ASM_000245 /LENGTH=113 /DNA_ID=CAMNT_0001785879 /DNA_START=396 /DNA_END=737 /DNA_ORIENTATION=-
MDLSDYQSTKRLAKGWTIVENTDDSSSDNYNKIKYDDDMEYDEEMYEDEDDFTFATENVATGTKAVPFEEIKEINTGPPKKDMTYEFGPPATKDDLPTTKMTFGDSTTPTMDD